MAVDRVTPTGTWALLGTPDLPGLTGLVPGFATLDDLLAGAGDHSTVVVPFVPEAGSADAAREAREATQRALLTVQRFLTEQALLDSRVVVVTRRATGVTGDTEQTDPPYAAVAGLVRSAQSENPGRFVLVDVDEQTESLLAVPAAVELGEPEVVVRAGQVFVPRLARAAASGGDASGGDASDVWRAGTGAVLVTGGTSGLGALVARHLVVAHGV
ncbi:type I polyketide synthase, partial [Micromonospora sp. CPCC 206060]|uniref:SpnB-like Rossmann fold domain-containing protein n=1 Tax=Micromonospora sp. CPCC 206060 TaxID=3122406 RepID=UPI003054D17A